MIIVIGFEFSDAQYEGLVARDMHGDDTMDLINEMAIEQDSRHHVWHFPDEAATGLHESLSAVFDEFSAPKTREVIERYDSET